ncbi:hypothetical protein FRC04_008753 [Tulasnella sp. 424]|nr:hypothetical protein FRC04_008753 [Tulasnella sp. 424]KAG8979983.1 hypothetical protein FRC05_007426 [Tulasnella sp. 425]
MPIKRKASVPSSPPSTKRKTRSGGDADVFVPLFDWDEPSNPGSSPTKRKAAASSSSRSLLKQTRGTVSANDASVSELAPTELDQEDDGSGDDLDVLGSRPISITAPRLPRSAVASSSRTSSAGSPAPNTPRAARNRHNFLGKSQLSLRFGADDEDDEEEDGPVSPTKAHRSIRPLPLRTRPRPLSTSSAVSDQSDLESPLKVSVSLKGKGKAREVASSGSEAVVEELVETEAADDDDHDDGVQQSPSKRAGARVEIGPLSPSAHRLLDTQRKAILQSLLKPPIRANATGEASKHSPLQSLVSLLQGSTERGEGNSCLVLGQRGSGKSRLIEDALESVQSRNPVVIRLSGEAQHDDRLAMREMARQLVKQTGSSYILPTDDGVDTEGLASADTIPTTHLPALIATLTTLSRPTIVALESFDLFATHARQALLYCLLDTAQACHAHSDSRTKEGPSKRCGIAVVGLSARMDTLNLLEKRVKSRFSGRLIRVSPPSSFEEYVDVAKMVLQTSIANEDVLEVDGDEEMDEWPSIWNQSVEAFLSEKETVRVLKDLFSLRQDIRSLCQVLLEPVMNLSPNSPALTAASLRQSFDAQIGPPPFAYLRGLSYPCLSLLIATYHISNTGHDAFNFEMLWNNFSRQVERTSSMPVMLGGTSVGMIKVPREVMVGAFENLAAMKVFQPTGPSSSNITKPFVKYRCAAQRGDIVEAVEKSGNLKLKSWLKRGGAE